MTEKPALQYAFYISASRWLTALAFCVLVCSALSQSAWAQAPAVAAQPVLSPQANLDKLFGRLAQAKSPEEAQLIMASIERLWLRSGSDTADLLMNRAVAALNSRNFDLASEVLDKIIDIEPDWAEAWNKRATVRYLREDDRGSVADIAHVLALEPRHTGALAGLGFILQRNGSDKGALRAFRQLLALNPQLDNIRKLVEKLVPEVEGREL